MKSKTRYAVIPVLLCLCICCALAGFAGHDSVGLAETMEVEVVTETELKDSYDPGETFTIPAGRLVYDGAEYPADRAELTVPSGAVYRSGRIVLDEPGLYTVEYRADIADGAKTLHLKAQKSFLVTQAKYGVTTEASSVAFGEFRSFTPQVESEKKSGLIVTLSEGDSFTWARPLTLTAGKNPIIDLYVDQTLATLAAGLITVTLTDCYDPSVTVSLSLDAQYSDNIYYATASAYGRNRVGLERKANDYTGARTVVNIDGTDYIRYVDEYGMAVTGMTDKKQALRWSFDPSTQRAYLDRTGSSRGNFVSDLDNKDLYDRLFEGFTTGEVYLTVSASDFRMRSVNIEIESISDERGTALLAPYVDDRAPVVSVNGDLGGKTLYAAVGESITLPDAEAFDIHLTGDIKKTVRYNYGSGDETAVLLKDGAFVAAKEGIYTAVYSATDSYGNAGKSLVEYAAVDRGGKHTVDIAFDGDRSGAFPAGAPIELPSYTLDGLNGETFVSVEAVHESGRRFPLGDGTQAFTPLYTGKYDIIYSYGDVVASYTAEKTVNVVSSDTNVLFTDDPVTERYYIKGASYSVEKMYAYTFKGSEPAPEEAELSVGFDGGEFVPADYGKVTITGSESVRFRYTYGGVSAVSAEIPVVDVGYGDRTAFDATKYFRGEGFTRVRTDDGEPKNENNRYLNQLRYLADAETAAESDGTLRLEFVNAISLASFKFEFSFIEGRGNFKKFSVILTDYYDSSVGVSITWRENNGAILLGVGDLTEEPINHGFSDPAAYQNKDMISYTTAGSRFIENSGAGHEFKYDCGFTSDKCFLSVVFEGVTGDCGLDVYSLCGQSLYASMTKDESAPMVFVSDVGGICPVGERASVAKPVVTDVLSPVLEGDILVTVREPDSGKAVTATDGTTLDRAPAREYEFDVTAYGSYSIVYIVKDGYGIEFQKLIVLSATNLTPPVITLEGVENGGTVYAALGSKVTVAKCTVTDDDTADCTLIIALITPLQVAEPLTGGTFVATIKGTYRVCYQAYDGAGNPTLVSYNIVVA